MSPDNSHQALERHQLRTLLKATIPYLPLPVVEKQLVEPQTGRVEGEYWEGSVLFADLSGFTALSETLTRLGKEGAEVVTGIVNDLFEALLEDVERYGGILVKFGGDAMTVFFGGEYHALRSAHAGLALQKTMSSRFVSLETPGGIFTLRLRAGVHTGKVFAAQVGYEPAFPLRGMELVVAGAEINRVAEAQDYAAPGQVCVTAEMLAQLGDQVDVEPVGGGMYHLKELRSATPIEDCCPPRVTIALEDRPTPYLRAYLAALQPYLPIDLQDGRITDPSDPELRPGLRPVAVLFANFRDTSAILASLADKGELGVHTATRVLNAYYARMQDVIGRYGGVINKVDMYTHGDKLMAIFGAPFAHEDDAERAVRAALEMQRVMPEVNRCVCAALAEAGVPGMPFTQRIGINYGHVFAGNVGSEREGSRREYTVMGDSVNLAARLMAVCEEGGILISPAVRRRVADKFLLEELPPVPVKGKARPVLVARPVRPLTEQERAALPRGQRYFIGRAEQLKIFEVAATQTVGGQGQVVAVVGEAGTGKTRLVEAFADLNLAQATPAPFNWYTTELPSYAQEPYAPIVDLLRRLMGLGGETAGEALRLERWLEAQVPDFGHFLPLLGDLLALSIPDNPVTSALTPDQRRQRLFDLIEAVLHAAARRHPLALVVDDLQWADESSLALLAHIAQGVAGVPLMLVLCYRPDGSFAAPWEAHSHSRVVHVGEFTQHETARMVSELLGSGVLPQGLTELVWARAQGNPFFTEEFVKALRETGVILAKDGHWELLAVEQRATAIPDTVEGVVLARLDRLEARCRDVLQEAAVATTSQPRFSRTLLERVDAYPAELPGRLTNLVGGGLLEQLESELEAFEYHFRHTLTRDVAYAGLLYARRRELHRLIAQAIEAVYAERLDEYIATLAHHFDQAEDWLRAFHYHARAGERAQVLFANKDAIGHFGRSLAISEGQLPDMLAAMAPEELGIALTAVHENMADVLLLAGDHEEALSHYESARAMVKAEAPSFDQARHLADLCRKTASVYERCSSYEAAFNWLETGLGYLPEGEPVVEAARIYLLGAGVYQRQGKNDEAVAWCQKSLNVASQIPTSDAQQTMARAYYNLGGIHIRQGALDNAVRYCRDSVRAYREIGDIAGQSRAHINLANAYFEQGNWPEATQHYHQALEIQQKIGDVYYQAFITVNLGGVYRDQGDLEQASRYYQQSLGMWRRLGSTYVIALLHNNMSMVALRKGDVDEALELSRQSAELFKQIGSEDYMAEVHRHLAEAYLGRGELDEAVDHARSALALAQAHELRLEEGATRRVLGQIHCACQEPERAEEMLQESLHILQELNSQYEMGQTLYRLALLYDGQQRQREAREALHRAIAVFERLGARLDWEWAMALLGGGDKS